MRTKWFLGAALLLAAALLAAACERTAPAPAATPAAAPAPAPTAAAPAPTHEHHGDRGPGAKTPTAPSAFEGMPAFGTKAWCPVSKEEFTVNAKTLSSNYKGKTYVFCCPDCKPDFDKNPAKYVN